MKTSLHQTSGLPLLLLLLALAAGAGCSGSAAKQRHIQRADEFFELKRYDEAIIEYLNVLRLEPTNAAVIRKMGLAYFATGDIGKAFPFVARTAAQHPEDTEIRGKLASLYLAGGAIEEARKLSAELMAADAGNLDALLVWAGASQTPEENEEALALLAERRSAFSSEPRYFLGVGILNLRRADLARAEEALLEAARLDPGLADAQVALGDLAMMKGDPAQAEAAYRKAYALAPGASSAAIKWAKFKEQSGDPAEARKILENLTREAPQFVAGWQGLAELDYAGKRWADCMANIERSLKISPSYVPALLLRAQCRVAQGELGASVLELQELVRQYPTAAALRFGLARLLLRQNQAVAAEKELREVLRLKPRMAEATLLLAEVQLRTGQAAAAVALLESMTATRGGATPQALLLLGAAHRMRQEWDAALAAYDRMRQLMPGSARPVLLAAVTQRAAGRHDAAAASFAEALELEPTLVAALAGLVTYDMEQSRSEEALARIDRQLEKSPGVAEFHYLRGQVAMARCADREAESSYLKAIELKPRMSATYRDLGRLYVKEGRTAEAIAKLSEAAAANPRDTASLMMAAMLQQQQGNAREAAALYEQVLAAQPQFSAALNNLADLYARDLGDVEKGLDLAQRAREQAPDDPLIADTLGWIALRKGDYRWALSLLQDSAGQAGQEPEILFHLAQAHQGLGQENEARAVLARALASGRDFRGRDEARKMQRILETELDAVAEKDGPALEEALRDHPGNPSILVRLAMIQERGGHLPEAVALNEQALAANPQFMPAIHGLLRLYVQDAAQLGRAMDLGRKARELAPRDPEVAHWLGWAAFLSGDIPWSYSLMSEAATLGATAPALQLHLAQAAALMGRLEDSRALAQKAAEQAGNATEKQDAVLLLGFLDAYEGNRTEEAQASVQQGLASQPDHRFGRIAAARLQETDAAAVAAYEPLLAAAPNAPLLIRDLAVLLARQDKRDDVRSLKLALKARELLPRDAGAARALGLIQYQQGQYEPCAWTLQQAVAMTTEDATASFCLGASLHRLGKTAESAAALQRALDLGLSPGREAEARALLQEQKAATPAPET